MDKKSNGHKPVGSEEKTHRARLGTRSGAQVAETKHRLVDREENVPSLEVAAFQSFLG